MPRPFERRIYAIMLMIVRYMNTLGNKKVELFDMGAGVSEPTDEENVKMASSKMLSPPSYCLLPCIIWSVLNMFSWWKFLVSYNNTQVGTKNTEPKHKNNKNRNDGVFLLPHFPFDMSYSNVKSRTCKPWDEDNGWNWSGNWKI